MNEKDHSISNYVNNRTSFVAFVVGVAFGVREYFHEVSTTSLSFWNKIFEAVGLPLIYGATACIILIIISFFSELLIGEAGIRIAVIIVSVVAILFCLIFTWNITAPTHLDNERALNQAYEDGYSHKLDSDIDYYEYFADNYTYLLTNERSH